MSGDSDYLDQSVAFSKIFECFMGNLILNWITYRKIDASYQRLKCR